MRHRHALLTIMSWTGFKLLFKLPRRTYSSGCRGKTLEFVNVCFSLLVEDPVTTGSSRTIGELHAVGAHIHTRNGVPTIATEGNRLPASENLLRCLAACESHFFKR